MKKNEERFYDLELTVSADVNVDLHNLKSLEFDLVAIDKNTGVQYKLKSQDYDIKRIA